MGALMGFIVGYLAGVKAGPEGLDELKRAWQTIQQSEEFKALLAAALGVAQNAMSKGGSAVVEQVSAIATSPSEIAETLGVPGGVDLMETVGRLSQNAELQQLLSTGMALLGGALLQGGAAGQSERPGA